MMLVQERNRGPLPVPFPFQTAQASPIPCATLGPAAPDRSGGAGFGNPLENSDSKDSQGVADLHLCHTPEGEPTLCA